VLGRWLLRTFVIVGAVASLAGLFYIYSWPPSSLRADRDGVPYHAPPIAHPFGGDPLRLDELVRHYKRGEQ
jgi:hypothetical protein